MSEPQTIGDVMSEMSRIYHLDDETEREVEAQRFMDEQRAANPEHADANIGYLTGYMGPETMTGMLKLFRVQHPVFGTKAPTPSEAFQMGSETDLDET